MPRGRNPAWTSEQDQSLIELVHEYGENWPVIVEHMKGQTIDAIATRWKNCLNPELIKGSFLEDEDQRIIQFVAEHGENKWSEIIRVLPNRTMKQCRERWINHLNPSVKKDSWSSEEDIRIFELYKRLGGRWSRIARSMPGRSDNSVKNRFNSSISKRIEFDETGGAILNPPTTRRYVQKTLKRRPARYALARQNLLPNQEPTTDIETPNPFTGFPFDGDDDEEFPNHWDQFLANLDQ